MTLYYAGIGSRETPPDVCVYMTELARWLSDWQGWRSRTGGAPGADQAIEAGDPKACLYLPWDYFEGRRGHVFKGDMLHRAHCIASKHHPTWHKLGDGARKLHARNVGIMLGKDLDDPVKFVLCWTKDGKATGGTGQALRMATDMKIPVFNLWNGHAVVELATWLRDRSFS